MGIRQPGRSVEGYAEIRQRCSGRRSSPQPGDWSTVDDVVRVRSSDGSGTSREHDEQQHAGLVDGALPGESHQDSPRCQHQTQQHYMRSACVCCSLYWMIYSIILTYVYFAICSTK